jgi:hypothetical protein
LDQRRPANGKGLGKGVIDGWPPLAPSSITTGASITRAAATSLKVGGRSHAHRGGLRTEGRLRSRPPHSAMPQTAAMGQHSAFGWPSLAKPGLDPFNPTCAAKTAGILSLLSSSSFLARYFKWLPASPHRQAPKTGRRRYVAPTILVSWRLYGDPSLNADGFLRETHRISRYNDMRNFTDDNVSWSATISYQPAAHSRIQKATVPNPVRMCLQYPGAAARHPS